MRYGKAIDTAVFGMNQKAGQARVRDIARTRSVVRIRSRCAHGTTIRNMPRLHLGPVPLTEAAPQRVAGGPRLLAGIGTVAGHTLFGSGQ
jgi:hypothetical protein